MQTIVKYFAALLLLLLSQFITAQLHSTDEAITSEKLNNYHLSQKVVIPECMRVFQPAATEFLSIAGVDVFSPKSPHPWMTA